MFFLFEGGHFRKAEMRINWDLFLYVYAFLLFLMNFIRIFDNAFWGDEGFSIRLAQMTVGDMAAATAADVHPPLYYLFVQLLYHVFGSSGVTYHLSALLPYAVIMIIGCTIVKKYFGIIPSVVLLTMSSLMKNAVRHNVEVRMYALAAMCVLIAYLALYAVIQENKRISWILFCIFSLGAAYTHYYALLSVAFFYAMLIPMAIFRKKYRKGLFLSCLVAVVGYLPWLAILVTTFHRAAEGWWYTIIPSIVDCCRFLLDYKWLAACVGVCFLLVAAYQIKLLSVEHANGEKRNGRFSINIPQRPEINGKDYWIISGMISIIGTAAVGLILSHLIRPLFMTRYLFPVSAVFYLIIGVCISKMKFPEVWCAVFVAVILLCNVPAYIQTYQEDSRLNRETKRFLEMVRPDNDIELVTNNDHLAWTLLEYYYPENNSKYEESALEELDTNYKDIWLIWHGELDETAERNIRKQDYAIKKKYEGFFADGAHYYVYELHRNK